MMKTALEIIQRMRHSINNPAPTSIESTTDPDELQCIELLVQTCEEIRATLAFPQSKRNYSFDTVASTSSYQLPLDFYSTLLDTHYNQDELLRLIGPASDGSFNYLLYGESSGTRDFVYRLFGMDQNPSSAGGQFVLYPTPTSAVTISFDIISRHMFLPVNWAASTAYSLDDEVNANGNIYKCTSAGTSGSTAPTGTAASGISDGTAEWGYDNEPYERPVNDTDLCIFDHDLVKLGLRAKWKKEREGNYEADQIEFEQRLESAKGRYKGKFRGSFYRQAQSPRYNIPYRNWSL